MRDYESHTSTKNQEVVLPTVFGRTVDSLLQQLLDFVIRDYIMAYLKEYCYDLEYLSVNIKEDLWGAIKNLHEKFLRVDHAKLIACDVINVITLHFEKIREAKLQANLNQQPPEFELSICVMSSEKELEYLKTLSEVLIMFLLPRAYSLSPTKSFLREVICCKIFKPFVDLVVDPDFFNRNLISYIEKANQQQINLHKKALEHVELYIDRIDDVQVLKQIRYSIVTKLMQATTLQNLNRAKGVDLENDPKANLHSSGIQKSEINAAKKLKKTINRLTNAKNLCENKLISLGCDLGCQYGDDFKKVPSLQTILEHITGRKYLSQFLQTLASHDLIRFWIAVEELRSAQRNQWHQLGAEIFYTFIRNPLSEIKVDKTVRKRMESFLLGDKGPEVFYEVQQQVVHTIEDKYYQPFLISDYYKEMIIAIEQDNDVVESDNLRSGHEEKTSVMDSGLENGLNVGDHSNYARRKLYQLEEKLNNKVQALAALRTSMRPESKVLSKLAAEVEWLEGEKRQLDAHIRRTEVWAENLGRWTTFVQSAEIAEEKEPPQFVLVVQMSEEDEDCDNEAGNICSGWVVCRSLTQFQELHKKLRPLCSDVRNLDLPSNTFKFLFGKSDKASLDKAKSQIQKYLDFVLKNEILNQSEAVYSFLSPSSEHLKQSSPSPKKSRFSFSTIFKSGSEQGTSFSILKDSSEENISQSLDTVAVDAIDFVKQQNGQGMKMSEDGKDSIAEPLYALLSELFDMRGVFKYLRKTLIAFVQVTYGRNINRQIYETISWWLSEEMLHYYVAQILKNFWPGGSLAPPGYPRTEEEKLTTAQKAQEMLTNNVPEILTTLVGSTAARNGAKKVFDALQEKNMNRQLFYEILEVILDAAFPELQ
ncbi:hypothetical protein ABEB36_003923 [Hypothenemus hampei]